VRDRDEIRISMDWFRGKFTGQPNIKNGKTQSGFLKKNPVNTNPLSIYMSNVQFFETL
jgi:hypothetical protein